MKFKFVCIKHQIPICDCYGNAAARLGRLGGKSKSKAKSKAAQRNGNLGGRPKK